MKNIILSIFIILSFPAFSSSKENNALTNTLKSFQENLIAVEGIHAIGVKLCSEPLAGNNQVALDIIPKKVKCIFVKTDDESLFLTLKSLFRDGERRLDGVIISPEWDNPSIPEPRLSVGN